MHGQINKMKERCSAISKPMILKNVCTHNLINYIAKKIKGITIGSIWQNGF